MKNPTFFTLVLFGIFALTGCNKVPDPEVVSQFVSTYSVTETWTENGTALSKPAFTMTIVPSTQHNDVMLLNNFANYGAGFTVAGTISGNTITIAQQTLSNSITVSGSGTLLIPTLTITYTEVINGNSIVVTATATKI
jgi:hypothetical protein